MPRRTYPEDEALERKLAADARILKMQRRLVELETAWLNNGLGSLGREEIHRHAMTLAALLYARAQLWPDDGEDGARDAD